MRFPIVASSAFFLCATLCSNAIAAPSCKVDVRPIIFGGYNPLLYIAQTNTSGSVDVSCLITALPLNTAVPYAVGISAGISGSYTTRTMVRSADSLTYNIFTSSNGSQVWGDIPGGARLPGGFSGFTQLNSFSTNNHIMYAVMNPRQIGKALGDYVDNLTVTVYF
jgi:spore coat protein U-like protein